MLFALPDMYKYLVLLTLSFALCNFCIGQQTFLVLQKRNNNKNAFYKKGDEISFRTTENKGRTTGQIIAFRDSIIVFSGLEISVTDISQLYIDEKTKWWLRYKIEQLSLIVGGTYLLLDIINTGEINKDTLILSSALIGVGLVAKLLIGNRIRIKGKTKLKIISI